MEVMVRVMTIWIREDLVGIVHAIVGREDMADCLLPRRKTGNQASLLATEVMEQEWMDLRYDDHRVWNGHPHAAEVQTGNMREVQAEAEAARALAALALEANRWKVSLPLKGGNFFLEPHKYGTL
jgi:hypothetical protein